MELFSSLLHWCNQSCFLQLNEAIQTVKFDSKIRVVILRGENPGAFCAGMKQLQIIQQRSRVQTKFFIRMLIRNDTNVDQQFDTQMSQLLNLLSLCCCKSFFLVVRYHSFQVLTWKREQRWTPVKWDHLLPVYEQVTFACLFAWFLLFVDHAILLLSFFCAQAIAFCLCQHVDWNLWSCFRSNCYISASNANNRCSGWLGPGRRSRTGLVLWSPNCRWEGMMGVVLLCGWGLTQRVCKFSFLSLIYQHLRQKWDCLKQSSPSYLVEVRENTHDCMRLGL